MQPEKPQEKLEKYALIVAGGIEYESEYDGRMYTRCGYCHADLNGHYHDRNCETVLAREELGQEWIDEAKKRQEEREKERLAGLPEVVVKCEHCGKLTQNRYMRQHQRNSKNCLAIRGAYAT